MGFNRLKRLTRHFHHHKKDEEGNSTLGASASLSHASSVLNADASSKVSKTANIEPSEPNDDDHGPKAAVESISLWDRAYSKLQESDPKMVQKFEELAAHELKATDVEYEDGDQERLDPHGAGQAKMTTLITQGLEKTAGVAKVKAGAKSAVDFVLHFKDAIDAAMKASPAPAAVWTGVSLGLNLFLEPLKATETNREGIVYVVARIKWYDSLSTILLRENTTMKTPDFGSLRSSLEAKLLGLYKNIIKFTALSVLSYYRNQGLQFLRDFAGIDGLDSSLQAVKDEEELVRKDIEQFGSQAIQSHLSDLVVAAESQQIELSSHLVNIEAAIERQTETLENIHIEEGDDDCLRDLWVTSPEIEMQAIESRKDELIHEAYDWILEMDAYKSIFHEDVDTKAEPENRLLWIRGDAGTGKTMTTMGIVRNLESAMQRHQDTVLSYFFVQATDDRLNNATAVLRTLVWYLAKQKRYLVSHLREHYKTAKDAFSGKQAFFLLAHVLQNMAQDNALSRVVLLIDALDECQESGLKDLMETVCKILENCPRVRIVLSSRPDNPWIEASLRRVAPLTATLQLSPGLLTQPVEIYIQQKTSSLMSRFQPETVDGIAQQLRLKACGTFLWVALVCKELEDIDEYDAEDVVKEMPAGLKQLYERMFQKIATLKRRDPEFCKSVLETITVAFRPLALVELGTLAGLPPKVPALTIAKKCGSFLTIRENTVYFIHQSAKDYLQDDVYHRKLDELNGAIFTRSLEGMRSILTQNIDGLESLSSYTPRKDYRRPVPDPLDPVRYCALHWGSHLHAVREVAHFPADLVHDFLKTKFLNWVEALTIMGEFPVALNSIIKLRAFAKKRSPVDQFIIDFTIDAERFLFANREIIKDAVLQIYAGALIFSPSESLMRGLFKEQTSTLISVPPIYRHWDPVLGHLDMEGDYLNNSVASSDGRLACRKFQYSFEWDVVMNERVEVFEPDLSTLSFLVDATDSWEEAQEPRPMAFLPGGDLVVYASGNLFLYDSNGQLMQKYEAPGPVWAVAGSPDGKVFIGLGDGTIRIMSADLQEKAILYGGDTDDTATDFVVLPDGCLVCATTSRMLQLWDHREDLHSIRPVCIEVFDAAERQQLSPEDRALEESGSVTSENEYTLQLASNPKGLVASLWKPKRGRRCDEGVGRHIFKLWRPSVEPRRGLDCVATTIVDDSKVWYFTFLSDNQLIASVQKWPKDSISFRDASGELVASMGTSTNQLVTPLIGERPRYLAGTSIIDTSLMHVSNTVEHDLPWLEYGVVWTSPDEKTFICHAHGEENDDAYIWDISGPVPILQRTIKGIRDDQCVGDILFSQDGTKMAVFGYDSPHMIGEAVCCQVWDTISGRRIPLPAFEENYRDLDHQPLSVAFAWDCGTFAWINGPKRGTEEISSFKLSVADLGDGTVRECECSLDGFGGTLTTIDGMALSPDARILAVAIAEEETEPVFVAMEYPKPHEMSVAEEETQPDEVSAAQEGTEPDEVSVAEEKTQPQLGIKGVELVDLATGGHLESLKLDFEPHSGPSEYSARRPATLFWSPDGRFVLLKYGLVFRGGRGVGYTTEIPTAQVTMWEIADDVINSWTFRWGHGDPAELPFDIYGPDASMYRETAFGSCIRAAMCGTQVHPRYTFHETGRDDYHGAWLCRNNEQVVYVPRQDTPCYSIASNEDGVFQGGKHIIKAGLRGLRIWSFAPGTVDGEDR